MDKVVFIGYLKNSTAYRVYHKRTKIVNESVNVSFEENTEMVSEYNNSEPGLTGVLATELIRSENASHEAKNDEASSSKSNVSDLDLLFENFYDEYFGTNTPNS